MKSLKTVFFVSALVLFLTATNGLAAKWVLYGEAVEGSFKAYYDSRSIANTAKGTRTVWIKRTYSDSGKADMISQRARDNQTTEGYEDLSQSNMLFEIDCHKRMATGISVTDYNKNGKPLDSVTFRDRTWEPISPETMGEILFKAVCKSKTKR
jgi:hypothetical protein